MVVLAAQLFGTFLASYVNHGSNDAYLIVAHKSPIHEYQQCWLGKLHCVFPYWASLKKKKNQKHAYTRRIKLRRISIHQTIGMSESRNSNRSSPEVYNQAHSKWGSINCLSFRRLSFYGNTRPSAIYLFQKMMSVRTSLKDYREKMDYREKILKVVSSIEKTRTSIFWTKQRNISVSSPLCIMNDLGSKKVEKALGLETSYSSYSATTYLGILDKSLCFFKPQVRPAKWKDWTRLFLESFASLISSIQTWLSKSYFSGIPTYKADNSRS